MDLVQFQSDVLENNAHQIEAFMHALSQERGNKNLEALAQHYGFMTWVSDEDFKGDRVILARDLAQLCYAQNNTRNLSELCRKNSLKLLNVEGYSKSRLSIIREHFALSKATSQVTFAAWAHVLLAGANGETPFARKLWAYIQQMVSLAEADQESRAQTGLGLQENVAQQQRQRINPRESHLIQEALEELETKKAILLAMGYHPSMALMGAAKHAERITGLDLSEDINGSPLMRAIPPEHQYAAVSSLERRFQLPKQGNHGHFLNTLIRDYGMQERLGDGTWQPSDRALADRLCMQVLQKKGTWQGYVWHWQIEFVAKIADWAKRSGRSDQVREKG